VLKLILWY